MVRVVLRFSDGKKHIGVLNPSSDDMGVQEVFNATSYGVKTPDNIDVLGMDELVFSAFGGFSGFNGVWWILDMIWCFGWMSCFFSRDQGS